VTNSFRTPCSELQHAPGRAHLFPFGGLECGKAVPFFFQVIVVPTMSSMVPKMFPKFSMFSHRFSMKVLTCSPKLLMCSTRCSQIAPHRISCLFPKFELSYKSKASLYASVLGSAQCFKRIVVMWANQRSAQAKPKRGEGSLG